MPPAACPNCRQPTPHRLEVPGQEVLVGGYYRCDQCRHVWTLPADADADGTIAEGPEPLDVYRVVIKCPNTGRAIPTGHELSNLEGFAAIGLQPEACRCPVLPELARVAARRRLDRTGRVPGLARAAAVLRITVRRRVAGRRLLN